MKGTPCRLENGNCVTPDPLDGLAVQCVGSWTLDKLDIVRRFINASAGPRAQFLPPPNWRGGAAFLDLFAGPGRARVRSSGQVVDGSPLIALRHERSPFSRVIMCEVDPENADTLRSRTEVFGPRAVVVEGDCNDKLDQVLAEIPSAGLNISFVDPYGLSPLHFQTLHRLCTSAVRMDLLLHFPTSGIRRNFHNLKPVIDRLMGTNAWRPSVKRPEDVPRLIPMLRERLGVFGFAQEHVRDAAVKYHNRVLYHIVYASKHGKGRQIWDSITCTAPGGQREMW